DLDPREAGQVLVGDVPDVLPARLQGELGDAFGHGGGAEGFTGVGVDRDHVRFAGGERGRTGAVLGEGRREVDRGALDRLLRLPGGEGDARGLVVDGGEGDDRVLPGVVDLGVAGVTDPDEAAVVHPQLAHGAEGADRTADDQRRRLLVTGRHERAGGGRGHAVVHEVQGGADRDGAFGAAAAEQGLGFGHHQEAVVAGDGVDRDGGGRDGGRGQAEGEQGRGRGAGDGDPAGAGESTAAAPGQGRAHEGFQVDGGWGVRARGRHGSRTVADSADGAVPRHHQKRRKFVFLRITEGARTRRCGLPGDRPGRAARGPRPGARVPFLVAVLRDVRTSHGAVPTAP